MDPFHIQLIAICALLLGNLIIGFVPCLIGRAGGHVTSTKKRLFAFVIQFGGGVFMSICFLVLIPESQRRFAQHETKKTTETDAPHLPSPTTPSEDHTENFPIPEFVILCGYFLAFGLEEVLHYFLFHFRRRVVVRPNARVRFCSCAKRHTECSRTFKADLPDQTMFGMHKDILSSSAEGQFTVPNRNDPLPNTETNLLRSSIVSEPVQNYGTVANVEISAHQHIPVVTTPVVVAADGTMAVVQQNICNNYTSSTGNILLWISSSLYSIQRGISIGLVAYSKPWIIVLVMGVQQIIVLLIVGSVLFSDSHSVLSSVYILTLSVMSPIGITISTFVASTVNIPIVLSALVYSLVCGCLLYLTFNDLLRRHVLKGSPGLEKLAAFSLGIVVFAVLEYFSTVI